MEEEFDLSQPFQADPNMSRTQNLLRQRVYLKANVRPLWKKEPEERQKEERGRKKKEEAKKRRLEMITERMYDDREMEEANNALNSPGKNQESQRAGLMINPPRFNLQYRSKTARRQDEIDNEKERRKTE